MTRPIGRRLDELLLLHATQALTATERSELDALLRAHGGEAPDSYARTAAAVHVGLLRTNAQMPFDLRSRIEQQALHYLRELKAASPEDGPGL